MKSDLVESWIRFEQTQDDSLFWASEQVIDMPLSEPEKAWEFIQNVSERCEDAGVLASLAAGPLEDLLHHHGPAFIERLETYTRQHPKFVFIAKGVWSSSETSDVWERVRALQAKFS